MSKPQWNENAVRLMRDWFYRKVFGLPDLMDLFHGSKWMVWACVTGMTYRDYGGPISTPVSGKGRIRRGPERSRVWRLRALWKTSQWPSIRKMAKSVKMCPEKPRKILNGTTYGDWPGPRRKPIGK